jgi:predicted nucleic acid-binding protein
MKYVLDANIVIKLFVNENFSEIASNLLEDIVKNQYIVFVPSLFGYEIFSVCIAKKIDIEDIKKFSKNQKVGNMIILELNNKIINRAKEITQIWQNESGFSSFYDSVYHAIALENNCDFITADKVHFEKVRQLGNIKFLDDLVV